MHGSQGRAGAFVLTRIALTMAPSVFIFVHVYDKFLSLSPVNPATVWNGVFLFLR